MFPNRIVMAIAIAATITLSGCAGGNGVNLATGSLNDSSAPATKTAKNAVSAQCIALYKKIDALRTEGTPERIKQVAIGKTKTAVVKREALARVSELDDAHQQLQSKCSRYTPAQLRAAVPRPIATAATKPAQAPAKQKTKTTSAAPEPKKIKTAAKTPPKSISAVAQTTAAKKTATAATPTSKPGAPTPIIVNASKTPTTSAVVKKIAATTGKSATTTTVATTNTEAATSVFPPIGSTSIPSAGTGGVVVTTPPQ